MNVEDPAPVNSLKISGRDRDRDRDKASEYAEILSGSVTSS